MKIILSSAIFLAVAGLPAMAQDSPAQPASANHTQYSPGSVPSGEDALAQAYYYFTMGHLEEQQYEITNGSDAAERSIESYKKALGLDPDSVVIKERLAEIYAKSQHISDAVAQAQEVLKADPDNVDAHRLLARIYVRTLGDATAGQVQQGNIDKAIEQFQAILKIEPDDGYSSLWLARLYRFENRHDDAEKVLSGVLQRDPDSESALEQLSQLLVDEGRSQDAISLLEKAAGDSSSPDIHDLLGDAYSQEKNYAKAEDAYQKAVEEDPDDPDHRHGLARVLLAENKYDEALEQYTKLSELEPASPENYLRMAQLERRLGKFDQAEASLTRAKQLAPGSLEVLYNEALLYQDEGRYDDAVRVLADAIASIKSQPREQDNSSALAILYEQLGHSFSEQRKYPEAIQTFQEMAKLGPEEQKRAEILLIDAYRESREIDAAIAEAKKALDASPKDPGLTVSLAMLYGEKSEVPQGTKLLQGLLQGNDADQEIYIDMAQLQLRGKQYADAERSSQKAGQMARSNSDKETAWYMLGAIYERQKKYDQAEQQFRKVLDLNPNNAAVLNYYGYMLANRGVRLEEATSLIRQAVQRDPNNGAYLDSLGWAYYKQNRLAEAEEYLQKAVDREGHDPTILSHLGDVYIKLGQNERAVSLLERSLAEWQKALPADYEADQVNEIDSQVKSLKRHLAQKSSSETVKPQ